VSSRVGVHDVPPTGVTPGIHGVTNCPILGAGIRMGTGRSKFSFVRFTGFRSYFAGRGASHDSWAPACVEWIFHGNDTAEIRFSPLEKIHLDNMFASQGIVRLNQPRVSPGRLDANIELK
jgi:hypothetical protein